MGGVSLGPMGGMSFGSVPGGLPVAFGQSYANMLGSASQTYGNVMSGYSNLLQSQQQAAAGITSQYGALNTQVQGLLGAQQAAGQANIARTYAGLQGQATQQGAAAGLGNTTIANQLQSGAANQAAYQYGQLAGTMGQEQAGFASQIGQAGLGFQGQALGQAVGIGQQQLGFMQQYPLAVQQQLAGIQQAGSQLGQQQSQFQQQLAYQQQSNPLYQAYLQQQQMRSNQSPFYYGNGASAAGGMGI